MPIVTVTLNAAVDKQYIVNALCPHGVTRVKRVIASAGGKGLNVARVLHLLGEDVLAMGLVGGSGGAFIKAALDDSGIAHRFTEVEGETRVCLNIRDEATGGSTEYLEPGFAVPPQKLDSFYASFGQALEHATAVALSGSLPGGVPAGYYARLIAAAKAKGVPVILDTSGEALALGVAAKPDLCKPNADEIAQLLGTALRDENGLADAAAQLQKTGIGTVVLSRGAEGALAASGGKVYKGIAPKITPVNTVGCGDSMVAAFAAGLANRLPFVETLRHALAVSAANALNEGTGQFDKDSYEALLEQAQVQVLR